ncbi:MAG: hypothetical protein PHT69_04425 [Bacteroidales bacterium]|nr:hypothetical protein [Bacteroidales bacterium]
MKNDLKNVCIKQDKEHETKMSTAFETAKQNTEKALQLYEQLTGEALKPDQWAQFFKNPYELVKTAIQSKIKVPEGYNRQKYLELMELPDTTELFSLLNVSIKQSNYDTQLCTPTFLTYDGENVSLTESAKNTITANNIYISDDENEYLVKLQKIVKLSKELYVKNPKFDRLINPNSFFIKIENYPKFNIIIDEQAFCNFMRTNF